MGYKPQNLAVWGKYEGQKIEFLYEPGVLNDGVYYWLRIVSKRIEEIRTELGLSIERLPGWSVPPEGFAKYFHITIGNTKYMST